MSDNTPAIRKRLLSLDILRGADMFLLTVIGPLAYALNKSFGLPKAVLAQFDHAWGGFTLWDIIMPLFIFMSGAAVPFAMKGRLDDNRARWRYWRHVLSRFALLRACRSRLHLVGNNSDVRSDGACRNVRN